MFRAIVVASGIAVAGAGLRTSLTNANRADLDHAPTATKQLVAVYLTASGTNWNPDTIRAMKASLARVVRASGRELILRGVSLEPGVENGIADLARIGPFDEISVGGNWTNALVVQYLGPAFGEKHPRAGIPQVILLEREVTSALHELTVGPEHELARFAGTKEISDWVAKGTPLP